MVQDLWSNLRTMIESKGLEAKIKFLCGIDHGYSLKIDGLRI